MSHYIVQHIDSESSIGSYFSVEANSFEEAVLKAEEYVINESFTPGSNEPPMIATKEEISILEKFGILF